MTAMEPSRYLNTVLGNCAMQGATPVAISEQMVEWETPPAQPAAEHSPAGSSRRVGVLILPKRLLLIFMRASTLLLFTVSVVGYRSAGKARWDTKKNEACRLPNSSVAFVAISRNRKACNRHTGSLTSSF